MTLIGSPLLSIIVTTCNRPRLLERAVRSALDQTLEDLEVIVVDDGSAEAVHLPRQPRLSTIRLPASRGVAAARNAGLRAAQTRWIAFLDDDDELLPHFAQVSLQALAHTTLPQPVAVLSGLEVVDQHGEVIQTHLPPTLPRGSHFGLEKIDRRQSFWSKATLVVERKVLLEVGGFDESFTSLVYSEMFLRLNRVCSMIGLPVVTYRAFLHEGPQLSRNASLRQLNFNRFISKHESFLTAHPRMFATLVLRQALALYNLAEPRKALVGVLRALRIHPVHSITRIVSFVWSKVRRS